MPLPTVNDVGAVDPVLQNMLVGYMQAENRFVAQSVFPVVPVQNDSGTYYIFDKKYWFTDEMRKRAPGQPFHRGDRGVSTATYSTLQWALKATVGDEERENNQIPIDLVSANVMWLNQKNLIRLEVAIAAAAFASSVWDTDSTPTDWDDFTNGAPFTDIEAGIRTISQNTGQVANELTVGRIVHSALQNHPDVLDRMKYTQAATKANVEQILGAMFDLNYRVSNASYNSANEGQSASMAAIIDDDALLTFSNPASSRFLPSAGYTFAWGGGGGNGSMYSGRNDEDQYDYQQIKAQWQQKVVATDCGYFWPDIV